MVEGTTTTTGDPDELLSWATRIAARYVGEQRAERCGKLNAGSGAVLVRVNPVKIRTRKQRHRKTTGA
jgi:hypothetical protein